MGKSDISIVILSKNEEKYILSTLEAVYGQNIDKRYEVILIDSGSKDSTLDIARDYPVKIIKISAGEFGHGKTRNFGTQITKGKFIVFLNADATPVDEYWLKNLIDNFQFDEKIVGVYSRLYPRKNCNLQRRWEILDDNYYFDKRIKFIDSFDEYNKLNTEDKRKLISFHTISCAIKKEFLFEYPFKDINFGEDLEWGKRIIEDGYKIVYESGSGVYHSHNFYNSFIDTLRKNFDDAKLNNFLLNRWSFKNIHILLSYTGYKLLKDLRYIFNLDKTFLYKIGWILYAPIIRFAEFCGITLALFDKLPRKLQHRLSLANQVIKQ